MGAGHSNSSQHGSSRLAGASQQRTLWVPEKLKLTLEAEVQYGGPSSWQMGDDSGNPLARGPQHWDTDRPSVFTWDTHSSSPPPAHSLWYH